MKNEVLIKASALNIAYGEKTAVENLSFELRRGEILCLAGESGSGKSTVLKALISSPDVKILSGSLE
ncbi:MAG: ATP-binding cassette domain-containing protein, partial [Lachnospiraceae bacterium]|nr:ATP-binding cassette domain-containing protein [Lachnospiraceae bacterium]